MLLSVKAFFHTETNTFSYIAWDSKTSKGMVIDPVLDYTASSGRIAYEFSDRIIAFIETHKLDVEWVLETHAHADHISAADYLRKKLNAKLGAGVGIRDVQKTFKGIYNLDDDFDTNGKQFDRLFEDGEQFPLGQLQVTIMSTPGHTNDSISYLVEGAAFIGDTLFYPDYGTARCDFPGGDAAMLYDTVQRLYQLPDETKLYLCHDYIPDDSSRDFQNVTTVAEQRAHNIHIDEQTDKAQYIELRETRDRRLPAPALIIPSIQVNIQGGSLPKPETNGIRYLKVPLNVFGTGTKKSLEVKN